MQEELVGLGCDLVDMNCNNAPNWLYSTTYWTGTATSPDFYLYVASDGALSSDSDYHYVSGSNGSTTYTMIQGIRPVVTIEIPEEPIEESDYEGDMHYERKKEEEAAGGNPNTGVKGFLYVLALAGVVSLLYYLVNRRSYFKH